MASCETRDRQPEEGPDGRQDREGDHRGRQARRRRPGRQCAAFRRRGKGLLFKTGVLGTAGSNKFLFDHVGLVEAHTAEASMDLEAVAIEAGANDFEVLTHAQNDDIPEGATGARFITERTAVHAVSVWLKQHGWHVVTSEIGYTAKQFPVLDDASRAVVGEFLQALEDHDDVQRVWAAVK
jgi:transcriptional/translational regulatory protein YebC/TACO1